MVTKKSGGVSEEQLVVRLPRELLERVDVYAERLREEQPGPAWKRSDVVRLLLARALDDAERPKGRR
jgi:metal-responsive CopG/Arc/MetJ family transcriptional regulator